MYQNQNNQNGNLPKVQTPVQVISTFFKGDKVQGEFNKLLGANGPHFIASLLSQVSSSTDLSQCEPASIYTAAMLVASFRLDINPNLGFAYIIPYRAKQKDGTYKMVAQFQIGYKGLIQLAHRTGQYIKLHSTDVRQGELIGNNRLTGEMDFNWVLDDSLREQLPIIGFVCYFKYKNGFDSTFYMTIEEMQKHSKKYSKSFAKWGNGLWKDDFIKMAEKTVTKLHLSKKGELSTEMKRAIEFDQSEVRMPKDSQIEDFNIIDVEPNYVDNEPDYSDQEVRYSEESENEYNQRIFEEQLAKEQEAERLKELQNNPEQQGQSHGGISVSMHNLEQVTNDIKNRKKY